MNKYKIYYYGDYCSRRNFIFWHSNGSRYYNKDARCSQQPVVESILQKRRISKSLILAGALKSKANEVVDVFTAKIDKAADKLKQSLGNKKRDQVDDTESTAVNKNATNVKIPGG